jgi:hypothetical protein
MLIYRFSELCESGNVEDVEVEEVLHIVLGKNIRLQGNYTL